MSRIFIETGDITTYMVDAIVNAQTRRCWAAVASKLRKHSNYGISNCILLSRRFKKANKYVRFFDMSLYISFFCIFLVFFEHTVTHVS